MLVPTRAFCVVFTNDVQCQLTSRDTRPANGIIGINFVIVSDHAVVETDIGIHKTIEPLYVRRRHDDKPMW